jgi:hypothetical protein
VLTVAGGVGADGELVLAVVRNVDDRAKRGRAARRCLVLDRAAIGHTRLRVIPGEVRDPVAVGIVGLGLSTGAGGATVSTIDEQLATNAPLLPAASICRT